MANIRTVLYAREEKETVHASDIAREMSFSKPSISIAMGKLKDANLITINDKGDIFLTESGLVIAEKTLEKHKVLTNMLVSLGVDKETAAEDACRMEHDISDKTWEMVRKHWEENK